MKTTGSYEENVHVYLGMHKEPLFHLCITGHNKLPHPTYAYGPAQSAGHLKHVPLTYCFQSKFFT